MKGRVFISNNVEKQKKKAVWPIVVLVLFAGLAIGAGGSYVYFQVTNKDNLGTDVSDSKKDSNKEVEDKVNDIEVSIDSVYVNELIDQYDKASTPTPDLVSTIYKNDKTNVTELGEEYLRFLVMKKANTSVMNSFYIDGDRFQKMVKLLYGNQVSLDNKSFSIDNGCLSYVYNNGYYSYDVSKEGCGGTTVYSMRREVVDAVKKSDTLEATIAYAIVNVATKEVFTDFSANTPAGKIDGLNSDTLNVRENASKLHQFKYVFTYDKMNDGYYLNYVQKVK